jgi:succinate-semialdehyde dehydrogenase / glutarate-semialdehyde dehydrogenase
MAGMAIATTNPATGETLATFDPISDEELDARLEVAATAFRSYRLTSMAERRRWLLAAADLLDAERDDLGRLITTEMGKPIAAARAEVAKCAVGFRYYAEHGEEHLADRPADAAAVGASRAFVTYQPLGPVLAVMPWNFPFWQVVRFAAPALMAGNVGLLKHASNVPQSALALEDVVRRAGFPEGTFQTLLVEPARVERIVRDPRVRAATLTGSAPAGRAVASVAGDAIKPTVLELGGADPFVVLPSADLAEAARVAAIARCQNAGQSCIAAKRFIVHDAVADRFEQLFVEQLEALTVGDPMDEATDLGPLATESGRADVEALVADALGKGARLLTGGQRPDGPGWYYPPTALADVTPEMDMFGEEVFGPVAQLHRVADLDEAIDVCNATDLGLGSNVWTDEDAEVDRFVRDVEAGAVFVNGMVVSYPELPFGGVKASGYGRELAVEGIHAFCNVKTVWVGTGAG